MSIKRTSMFSNMYNRSKRAKSAFRPQKSKKFASNSFSFNQRSSNRRPQTAQVRYNIHDSTRQKPSLERGRYKPKRMHKSKSFDVYKERNKLSSIVGLRNVKKSYTGDRVAKRMQLSLECHLMSVIYYIKGLGRRGKDNGRRIRKSQEGNGPKICKEAKGHIIFKSSD